MLTEFEACLAQPDHADRLFELVDGEIIEKMPTFQQGMIAGNLITAINTYTVLRKLGRAAVAARHQMPLEAQDPARPNSCIPDVSYISKERGLPLVTEGAVPAMPDLAVEIQSPNQTDKDMLDSASYYLHNGARMVLLVYPDRIIVEKLPASGVEKRLYGVNDVIDFSSVIPGFTMRVRDIFHDPLEEET